MLNPLTFLTLAGSGALSTPSVLMHVASRLGCAQRYHVLRPRASVEIARALHVEPPAMRGLDPPEFSWSVRFVCSRLITVTLSDFVR